MLIKFGARNFCSFKEGVEVSFELPSNSKLKSVSDYSHAICVKGANGSGKTNVLKILSFLRTFCCDSFNKKPDDDIYIDSFFSNDQVIEVYIEFEIDKVKYRYELALTRKEIKYEKLSKKIRRSVLVIERLNNKIEKCVEYYKSVNQIKLRSNASFISTANQYEINELSVIYNFFSFISSNVHALGFYDYQPDLSYVSKLYSYNEVLFDFAKRVIKKCDLGIDDIVINKRIDANGKEIYYPIFYYQTSDGRKFLTLYDQSSGTKTMYYRLSRYLFSLGSGGVLIADELDLHLHPHIMPILLELFFDTETNISNAQIIFTTHNVEILDFMGKYRTLLVNKENNESYAYRLDEIPGDIIRNDRSIIPAYNSGKIGGVPKV